MWLGSRHTGRLPLWSPHSWHSSQVDRAFDGGDNVGDSKGSANQAQLARKRCADGTMKQVDVSEAARHRAWLRRGRFGVVQGAWRPRKVFRCAAKRWLANTDNQLRTITASGGWSFFVRKEGWGHWSRWPHAGLGLDLGSDGLCAALSLVYKYNCCVTMYPDLSHLYQRAQLGAMHDTEIFRLWLLLMVSWNLPHGKDLDDSRYIQLRQAMTSHYEQNTHDSSVLFNHFLPGLSQELEALGHTWSSRESVAAEAWSILSDREPLRGSGSRMSLCRFQSTIAKAELKVGEWWLDLFERTFLALEQDWLGSRRFGDHFKITLGEAEQPGESGGSTNPNIKTFEQKALRDVCQNSVVVSVMTLSDLNHLRLVKAVLMTGSLIKRAHGRQNKEIRSSNAACEFFLAMAQGSFVQDVDETIGQLSSEDAMRNADFVMPSATNPFRGAETEEINEDALAHVLGMFTLGLAGHTLRRGLFIYAWPWRMVKCLDSGAAASTMAEFRTDLNLWRSFAADRPLTKQEKLVKQRSLFNTAGVAQYIEADKELGGQVSEEFLSVVRGRHSGCYVTQAVEEMIGIQKNRRQQKGGKKLRTPARSYASVIGSSLLSTRHHFQEVDADIAMPRQKVFVDKSAFKAEREHWSMDWSEVQGSSQCPSWYSPSASNWVAPCSDLWMLRSLQKQNLPYETIGKAWLGSLLNLKNLIVFNYQDEPDREGWYIGLQHIEGSCLLCWPLARTVVPGHANEVFYEPKRGLKEPSMLFIHEITGLESAVVAFRSPLWQWQHLPAARGKLDSHLRMFECMTPRPLPKLLAANAYFELPRSLLHELAGYLGHELPPGSSLFETLFGLVQAELGLTDSQVLDIIRRRLGRLDCENDLNAALLQIDEAADLLERSDVQVLHEEQRSLQIERESRRALVSEYKARRSDVTKAAAKGRAKAKAKAVLAPRLDSTIEQRNARQLIPPHASIWRGLTRGQWCGHYPDYRRISRPWGRSETMSCLWVVRALWRMHIEANALDDSACTVEGLMTMELD